MLHTEKRLDPAADAETSDYNNSLSFATLLILYLPDGWQEGRWQFLLPDLVPVEVLEPAMVLDVVGCVLEATVALGHVGNEQVLHEGLGVPI